MLSKLTLILMLLFGVPVYGFEPVPPEALPQADQPSQSKKREVKETHKAKRRDYIPRTGNKKRRLIQLVGGPGYRIKNPDRSWATFMTVLRLEEGLRAYHSRYPQADPIVIHDLSRKGGGQLEPHRSHRTGRDADVRLILKHPVDAYVDATPRTLDLERTWFLLYTLIQTNDVEYVFLDRQLMRALYKYSKQLELPRAEMDRIFQYPRGQQQVGIIRHARGHKGHFHIRFHKEKPRPLLQS